MADYRRYHTAGFYDPRKTYEGRHPRHPSDPECGHDAHVTHARVTKRRKRDALTGKLTFYDANGDAYEDFHPNLTPREIFQMGAFGGTYWRPIYCTVTEQVHRNCHEEFPYLKRMAKRRVCSETYTPELNYFNVPCGASLDEWQSKGWICALDPYGWIQWYCRFYAGRRTMDDARQIKRWKGLAGSRGRFYRRTNKSPKILQTLLHWAVLCEE